MAVTSRTPQLHLALEIDGAGTHPAAHLRDPSGADQALTARGVLRAVQIAENAGVSFVTIGDALLPASAPARIDAVIRAASVAPVTSRIGLAPVVHPAAVEPFHLASQLSSLDHASAGRAAWVVGTGDLTGVREALDRPVPTGSALSEEVVDVVRVVRDLWDSWEDDAVIRDTSTGRYIDRDRLHYVDFSSGGDGPTASPDTRDVPAGARSPFSVKGPLIVPRSPQGQPVVVAADGALPEALVDVVLLKSASGGALATDFEVGHDTLTFLDLPIILDAEVSAVDRLNELDSLAADEGRAGFAGSANDLIELLRALRGQVDGVRLLPAIHAIDVPVLVRDVLPALRVDQTTSTPRPGLSLRDQLGLAHPENRYASTGGAR